MILRDAVTAVLEILTPQPRDYADILLALLVISVVYAIARSIDEDH